MWIGWTGAAGRASELAEALRTALAARATVGELCGALREVWGTYDAVR